MTNPTDEELDAAVAGVLDIGWRMCGWRDNKESWLGYKVELLQDWNALMAAVAKLCGNVKGNSFAIYQHDGFDACLYQCEITINGQDFSKCDGHSLARALALCIHAVVSSCGT